MTCTPEALSDSAVGAGFDEPAFKQLLAIQVWILTQLAGSTTDPNELDELTTGFQAMSKKQLLSVWAYLLCQIAQP